MLIFVHTTKSLMLIKPPFIKMCKYITILKKINKCTVIYFIIIIYNVMAK